ncbi:hypothetical protein [Polymorphospora sp. NPDC050346]|uniref:hypothetical protein n=1 Tax=Polymorphospora sp. NPDC050346 TaxID=3155780 RepID=UPI00340ECCC6
MVYTAAANLPKAKLSPPAGEYRRRFFAATAPVLFHLSLVNTHGRDAVDRAVARLPR